MPSTTRGFTIVELTVALTVLSVGVLGLAATFGSVSRMGEERTQVINRSVVFRNAVSTLQSVAYDQVPATFDATAGLQKFWCSSDGVISLKDPGDAIGNGEFQFFLDESAVPKSFADLALGFDLNGNGTIDFGPVTDYRLLPVRITFSYLDRGAPITIQSEHLFRPW